MRLLQWTSLLFLWPVRIAWKARHHFVFRFGLPAVIGTSLIYHGSYHPVAKLVDVSLAHTMVAAHIYWGLYMCPKIVSMNVIPMLVAVMYAGAVQYAVKTNKPQHAMRDKLLHATIHITLAIGSAFVLRC